MITLSLETGQDPKEAIQQELDRMNRYLTDSLRIQPMNRMESTILGEYLNAKIDGVFDRADNEEH